MKKNLISISIIILFVFGIGMALKKKEDSLMLPPTLGTFSKIPPQIDGFSCFIFNSKEDMKQKEYLGVGDDSYDFFLSLNGQLVEFVKKDGTLTAGNYKLQIEQKNSGVKGDEYYEILGKSIISDVKNNVLISKDFVGYCAW